MKRIAVISIFLFTALAVSGQQIRYEYEYDNAGNRTRRTIIQIRDRNEESNGDEKGWLELTDITPDGTVMKLFPNPTQESIRFELSGDNRIGDFVLSDITGRVVTKGCCDNPSLILDLSSQADGIYLLEVSIKENPYIYKIIKQ